MWTLLSPALEIKKIYLHTLFAEFHFSLKQLYELCNFSTVKVKATCVAEVMESYILIDASVVGSGLS